MEVTTARGNTVRNELLGAIAIPAPTLDNVLAALGIEQDMTIETLTRRLRFGKRYDELVEKHGANSVGIWTPAPPEDLG